MVLYVALIHKYMFVRVLSVTVCSRMCVRVYELIWALLTKLNRQSDQTISSLPSHPSRHFKSVALQISQCTLNREVSGRQKYVNTVMKATVLLKRSSDTDW